MPRKQQTGCLVPFLLILFGLAIIQGIAEKVGNWVWVLTSVIAVFIIVVKNKSEEKEGPSINFYINGIKQEPRSLSKEFIQNKMKEMAKKNNIDNSLPIPSIFTNTKEWKARLVLGPSRSQSYKDCVRLLKNHHSYKLY